MNPGGDEIFRPSRPALRPIQPPVKWVQVLPGGKLRPGLFADHSKNSSAAVMEDSTSEPDRACKGITSSLLYYNKIF